MPKIYHFQRPKYLYTNFLTDNNKYLIMTDYSQSIRRLGYEFESMKNELTLKERQIESMKEANKSQKAQAEHQSKRILALEGQISSFYEDSSRVKQIAAEINSLNEELRKLKYSNMKLSSQNEDLKKKVDELQRKAKLYTKNIEQSQQLQRSKLLKQSKESQKSRTNLENQLSRAKKKIRELEEDVKSSKKHTAYEPIPTFINQLTKVPGQQSCQTLTSNQPQKVHFYQGVLLSQSLDENHAVIPETHELFFKLFDRYFESLMPEERIKFLNIVSADAEFKLDSINEEFNPWGFD